MKVQISNLNSGNRINWIDWSKVIAIYLVVLGHQLIKKGEEGTLHSFIYAFHMPFFFFISGFLWKGIDLPLKAVIQKGLRTLVIPYCFFHGITFFFLIPTFILSKQFPWDKLFYFATADGRGEAGPCWFLICLFQVQLLARVILKQDRVIQFLVIVGSITLAYCLPWSLWYRTDTVFMVLPFYIAGYYSKQFFSRKTYFLLNLMICLAGGIITGVLVDLSGLTNVYLREFGNYPALYYPMAFVGIVFLISLSKLLDSISSRVLVILSTGTIVIMGLHGIIGLYLSLFFKSVIPSLPFAGLTWKILFCLMVTFLSMIPIMFFQRYFPQLIGNRSIYGTRK